EHARRNPEVLKAGRVTSQVSGSKHHDCGARQSWSLPPLFGHAKAIHTGHWSSQENQRERPFGSLRLLQRCQRRSGISRQYGSHIPTAEYLFEDLQIDGIVVDHEHGEIAKPSRFNGAWSFPERVV